MRILSSLILAATIAIASPVNALNFEFELTGQELVQGGTGTVTGRILGLEDNTANQMADAVILDAVFFGDGSALDLSILSEGRDATQWANQQRNDFSVADGLVTGFQFAANNFLSGGGAFQDSLNLAFLSSGLSVNLENGFDFRQIADFPTSTGRLTFTQISAVPLPGAFGLLLTAIAGLGFLRRRKLAQA